MPPMPRQNISGTSPWEPRAGYSRAVRIGPHVWVAGTTATDGNGELVGVGDAGAQARQAFANVARALETAGARLDQVVRTRMYVTRIADAEAVAAAHGALFGDIRPASTLVGVSALVAPEMLVEVEAEAYVGD
jgi:enamine deaminase RidA (YjgF/YER057c/UK114 family)